MKLSGFLLAALAALSLSACSGEGDAPAATELVRPVLTVTAEPTSRGQTVSYAGEVMPHTETPIAFKSNGRIAQRLVSVGELVTKGQTLALMEKSEFEDQVRATQAEEAGAKAALASAQTALNRQTSLVEKGVASRAALDAAALEANAATARLETAQANLNQARQVLEHAELIAPMDGVVTATSGNVSQVVAAGQEVLRLATLDKPAAVFDVPEQLITTRWEDQPVALKLLSNPDIAASGMITEVSPVADPSTRTYRVRVAIENAPAEMIYGASVVGTIVIDNRETFEVPATSLTSMGGEPAVYVVDPATNTLIRKPVTITVQNEASLFITGGLTKGDHVVTAGVSKLRPGQTVKLAGADL